MIWYKFQSDTPKEAGRPGEWKMVLVQDDRLKNQNNSKGIGLGYCYGYDMTVVYLTKDNKFETVQPFRPAFWATLGNDDPKLIFEKPPYVDVTEKIYPDYNVEFRFKGRKKAEQIEETFEEIEL